MNVREMIAALSALDPELPVLVDGYEGGFDTARPPRLVWAVMSEGPPRSYWGEHGEGYDHEAARGQEGESRAVLLSRPDPE